MNLHYKQHIVPKINPIYIPVGGNLGVLYITSNYTSSCKI